MRGHRTHDSTVLGRGRACQAGCRHESGKIVGATPMPTVEIAELEVVLGHRFHDPLLLLRALTHSSRVPERKKEDPAGDNEKLEFLGDAILDFLVSEELVRRFPDWNEGQLSKSRARL